MSPTFQIDGGLPLALARAASVASLLSVSGALAFRVVVLPKAIGAMPAKAVALIDRRLLRLTWTGVAAGLLAFLAWLVLQAADMAESASPASALAAVPVVLAHTEFGHLVAAQFCLLLATALAAGQHRAALALATPALLLQAGHSHAAAMDGGPGVLLVAEIVHLLGAAAWLGGLLPLLLVVQAAPAKAGALAARWFSPMGKLCIVALTASALVQGWVLVGSIPGLVGTAYGWMALGKLGLFGVLFAFAVLNRYRLAPALLRTDPAAAKRALVRSIAVQTGFGLAIVAAAAVLGSLPPAMHEQPVWPFPQRLTLDTVQEGPDFLREVVGALLALGGAATLLVVAALLRRRVRWAAVVAAMGIVWFAVPHLDLLFVPAHPTSFYRSPTGFAAASIVQGAVLYPQHCAMCHGAEGHGDDPAANSSPIPVADLTAAHLWMHSDGELFWWLAHGIEAPQGGMAMPGFGSVLSDTDRWGLIDFVRAHNAGVAFAETGAWPLPVQAPGFQAACSGGRTMSPADTAGSFVRLAIGSAAGAVPGVITVLATSNPAAKPAPGLCIATDETLSRTYAIVAGLTPAEMRGAEFLIDGNGWLRAVQRPGDGPRWSDPAVLKAEIDRLAAYPTPGGNHAHTQM